MAGAGRRDQVSLGIVYMVGSTVMFAGGNAVVKWQLANYPLGEVAFRSDRIATRWMGRLADAGWSALIVGFVGVLIVTHPSAGTLGNTGAQRGTPVFALSPFAASSRLAISTTASLGFSAAPYYSTAICTGIDAAAPNG